MAKALQLDVLGDDKSARKALNDTADGLDRVANKADEADEQLREAADGADKLSTEIAKTEKAIKKLSAEFDKTGDRGLFKQLGKQQRELGVMLKLREQLDASPMVDVDKIDEDVDRSTGRLASRLVDSVSRSGAKVSAKVAGILGDSVSSLPPHAQAGIAAALVGGATVAAPLIGGVVASGLLAGVGGAGIGVGVAAALQDPAVAEAVSGVGERLKDRLASAIGDDFAAPTVQSVQRLEKAAGSLIGRTQDELAELAPVLLDVADGAAEMAERMGPGLEDALKASAPILRALGRELPELGGDISDFFTSVSEGKDGAVLALVTALDLLGATIRINGAIIEGAAHSYEMLVGGLKEVSSWGQLLTNDIPVLGDAFDWTTEKLGGLMADAGLMGGKSRDLTDETTDLALAQERAAKAAAEHADKLDELAGAGQNVRLATLDFKDGLAELSESVERNGTSLNENSEKGRNNLRVVESLISAADRAGQAAEKRAIAEGKSADAAAAAGAKMRSTFIADLISAAEKAGLSESKIRAMVKELQRADGQRARIYIDQNFRTFGKPYTDVTGIGGNTWRGLSSGGLVGGGGPPGIDTQPRLLASDEWVATGRAHQALMAAFGADGLEQLNRTGTIPAGAAGGGAMAGGAAAGAAAGGGPIEVVVRAILQWPDGSVITEQVTRHASRSGLGTLDAVFGIPAAAA
ncbi:hypothetical protein [Micromonospora sp. NPDC048063]|uniref:hypothetical protein n=1 Tax=Micromonospora sp. NPDC048063 TaxID=3364256 RepID=UPI0037195B53